MKLTRANIDEMSRIERLNLINSITGIKPANLIGTKSIDGLENLAIFSSVVHLGSNPPLIGCVTRPVGDTPRHTYQNIKSTGVFSINAVPIDMTEEGHYTSANFDLNESEFENCGFTKRYQQGFDAPFVNESPIQIGLKFVEEVIISTNNTRMIIGEVECLSVDDRLLTDEGYLDLERGEVAGISGLNSYYKLVKKADYPYARKEHWLSPAS